jgi:hypothetical protein
MKFRLSEGEGECFYYIGETQELCDAKAACPLVFQ